MVIKYGWDGLLLRSCFDKIQRSLSESKCTKFVQNATQLRPYDYAMTRGKVTLHAIGQFGLPSNADHLSFAWAVGCACWLAG
eukprot:scaffold317063_cov29-Prasinocladus_malaysianus.AAC.2